MANTASGDPGYTGPLPAGTTITLPHGAGVHVLSEMRFSITRDQLDKAVTAQRMNEKLTQTLKETALLARKLAEPTPTWITALKYTTTGLAVGAAFALGTLL